MKLQLPDVTLIALATSNIEGNMRAFDICCHYCDFGASKFLTSEIIGCSLSYQEYNTFMIKSIAKYVDTLHILFIHPDGFILNPLAWTDDFMTYDYIGAPWWCFPEEVRVGNGGFTLRSKRLCDILANDPKIQPIYDNDVTEYRPEDVFICRKSKRYLESKKGIRFAPSELAMQFSTEGGKWTDSFGYHGNPGITDISDWVCPI